MDRNMIEYLPPMLQTIREFKALIDAEQPEASDLWDALDDVLDDQFINDATANGVSRWEKILTIAPKGGSTLPERKLQILARLNEELPYTFAKLKNQLEALCGVDGYSVVLSNSTYTLTVRVGLTAKDSFDAVDNLLDRVIPANILIDVSLEYNTHQTLSALTHAQLAAYTHDELRSEVLI